jgi:hypothetical protein
MRAQVAAVLVLGVACDAYVLAPWPAPAGLRGSGRTAPILAMNGAGAAPAVSRRAALPVILLPVLAGAGSPAPVQAKDATLDFQTEIAGSDGALRTLPCLLVLLLWCF